MTIPTGPASLLDIQNEFGGSAPISLNEYYAGGATGYVPNPAPTSTFQHGIVPTSGPISIGNFLGLTKVVSGGQFFTSSGTYTIPAGVTSVRLSTVGGGGGGGGFYGGGDDHSGGSGGAGGYVMMQSLAVTAGETLQVVVGAAGTNARFQFEGTVYCAGNGTANGGNGGSSYIYRASAPNTKYALSSGGYGGNGRGDDNAPATDSNHLNRGSGNNGTPGTIYPPASGDPQPPRNGSDSNRRHYFPNLGFWNSTGYGTGGNSNANSQGPYSGGTCPTAGTAGMASVYFGASGSTFSYNLTIAASMPGFNLYNRLCAVGWDGMQKVTVNITINSGVTIYGWPGVVAFDIGAVFPTGSVITITNNGLIIGCGGNGGSGSGVAGGNGFTGLQAFGSGIVRVQNSGIIAGGGGGGGSGSGQGGGGGGGRGGGYGSYVAYGATNINASTASNGYTAFGGGQGGNPAGDGSTNGTGGTTEIAGSGGSGGVSAGSSSGDDYSPGSASGGNGGAGGGAGAAGYSGGGGYGTAGAGGSAGYAVQNDASITWLGLGTIYGARV